jgi:hypothetical protein
MRNESGFVRDLYLKVDEVIFQQWSPVFHSRCTKDTDEFLAVFVFEFLGSFVA